ncbi:MAG: hypothetical protein CM15mP102_06900 [Flavobacteriales bacterium]|nr:MAG: hypothetical protein CM15mP102_06900 [Flavobacteriales bacterium]
MTKRGELKNISKVIEEVFSQKQIRIGIDNIKVQDAWKKPWVKNSKVYFQSFYKREHFS